MDELPQGLAKFRATNREECGLIIEAPGRGSWVVKVPNHAERDDDYAILVDDCKNVSDVLADDETIVGFFHTHLPHHSIEPSDADLDGAELFPGLNNLIYKPDTGEHQWYGVVEEVVPAT